jgi:hypothetical protein
LSQTLFKNPFVTSAAATTGIGSGTVTIDKLTHFTLSQTYTLTCIAKSPDTLFSVSGSLDGGVGIATVGTQFFDHDLKIFLTIQQGATAFEVGDQIVFTVQNGTDLTQQNIDAYDELPQKNFGAGISGLSKGDHSLRFSTAPSNSYIYFQDIFYTAKTAGSAGDAITIEYANEVPGAYATLALQDLTFTSKAFGTAGNSISVQYVNYTRAFAASITLQDILYQAPVGAAGNNILIGYVTGGTAGAETVTKTGNTVTVTIQSGVSTATQIVAAVLGSSVASTFSNVQVANGHTGSTPQTAPTGPQHLSGGSDAVGAAGSEVVNVSGNTITVTMQSGVATATQIKTALDNSVLASDLISTAISGSASHAQTEFATPAFLHSGTSPTGAPGAEVVTVTGNAIKVTLTTGVSTANQIITALANSAPATALVNAFLIGNASSPQIAPITASALSGGKNKFYAFNHDELSDPSNFVEGNASLKIKDLNLSGSLNVSKRALFTDALSLDDTHSVNSSGAPVSNVQQYINRLIEDQKLTLRTSDYSPLFWSKPTLTFTGDLVIDFPDTDNFNTILASNSPITIADGQSCYVIIDRDNSTVLTPIVANTVPNLINCFRLASRFGSHIILWDNTLIRDGRAVAIGEGGIGAGAFRVDLYDPLSTSLPTGAAATFDSVAISNGQLVLFSNLASGNNQVYRATGVGSSIVWTPIIAFSAGLTPALGDQVLITKGTGFKLQTAIFDGTTFKINDTVRYFNGVDYWEMSSLKSLSLGNNASGAVFSVTVVGSENFVIDYSIARGTTKQTSSIYLTSDGTSVSVAEGGTTLGGSTGVDFSGSISNGLLILTYNTDNSGPTATMKYFVRRWSNAAGGPGGIPDYSTSTGSGAINAAGTPGNIQYNSSGSLGADSNLSWNPSTKVLSTPNLNLGGFSVSGLSAPVTLADAVNSPVTFLTYPFAGARISEFKFYITRNTLVRLAAFTVVCDGTNIAFGDRSFSTGQDGITFYAAISGANVQIQYTSSSTGVSGSLTYTVNQSP